MNFVKALEKIEQPQIKAVLHKLCILFALYRVQQDLGDFTCTGYLTQYSLFSKMKRSIAFFKKQPSRQQVVTLNEAVDELLSVLRKDAVPLVDAFGFSDYLLNSSLGRYKGK